MAITNIPKVGDVQKGARDLRQRQPSRVPVLTVPGGSYPAPRPADEISLKAAVFEMVKRSASLLSMRHMGSQERDETGRLRYRGIMSDRVQATIRDELWHSEDGRALSDLARSKFAGLEKSKAVAKIEADPALRAGHKRALELLRQGRLDLGL